jgi:Rrf2 family protein
VNSRFPVSVHIVALLASRGELVTSEEIASEVRVNAVVVRRLVGLLQKAGIVKSKLGPGGGVRLSLTPREISLACVLNAVEDQQLLAPLPNPNPDCALASAVESMLETATAVAQDALCQSLRGMTIADVLERMDFQPCDPQHLKSRA